VKQLLYTPAARASLEELFAWPLNRFGASQADRYAAQLAGRLERLLTGDAVGVMSCSRLLPNDPRARALKLAREGRHFIVFRETEDALEIVEIFHGRMDIEARIARLTADDPLDC